MVRSQGRRACDLHQITRQCRYWPSSRANGLRCGVYLAASDPIIRFTWTVLRPLRRLRNVIGCSANAGLKNAATEQTLGSASRPASAMVARMRQLLRAGFGFCKCHSGRVSCPVPFSHSADCESRCWHDKPLQRRRKAGAKPGQHGHCRAIGPGVPDRNIQPLAQDRVSDSENCRGRSHGVTERAPPEKARE